MGTLSNWRRQPQVRKTTEHVLQNTEETERISSKNLWGIFFNTVRKWMKWSRSAYIPSCLQPVPQNHSWFGHMTACTKSKTISYSQANPTIYASPKPWQGLKQIKFVLPVVLWELHFWAALQLNWEIRLCHLWIGTLTGSWEHLCSLLRARVALESPVDKVKVR